jgi:hypothetical protein
MTCLTSTQFVDVLRGPNGVIIVKGIFEILDAYDKEFKKIA